MSKLRFALIALGISVLSVVMSAQIPLPTSYSLRFYPTAGGPTETVALASSTYVCSLPPTAPVPAGTRVYGTWDDPANASLRCRYYDQGTAAFTARPNRRFNVGIAGCIVVEGIIECGDESTRVTNFIYRVLPPAPTGFSTPTPNQAVIQGVIGDIAANWMFPNQPGWKIVNMAGPFGAFQMHVGGNNNPGEVNLPGYTVRAGQRFEITLINQ